MRARDSLAAPHKVSNTYQHGRFAAETERRLKELQPPRPAKTDGDDYLMKVKIDSKSFPLLFRFEALQEVWHSNYKHPDIHHKQIQAVRKSIISRAGGYLEKHIETWDNPKAEYITFRPSRWYWEIAEVLVAECDGITLAQYKHQLRTILKSKAAELVAYFALAWAAEGGERWRMESEDLPLQAERARQQAEVEARRDKASALRVEREYRQVQARLARMQDADACRSIIYTCDGSSGSVHSWRHPPCHAFNPVPPPRLDGQRGRGLAVRPGPRCPRLLPLLRTHALGQGKVRGNPGVTRGAAAGDDWQPHVPVQVET